jgi:hypothetical protein
MPVRLRSARGRAGMTGRSLGFTGLSHRSSTCKEHFGHIGIVIPTWSSEMTQMLGLSIALLLFGTGVWANVDSGSLSQNKGAWVSRAIR